MKHFIIGLLAAVGLTFSGHILAQHRHHGHHSPVMVHNGHGHGHFRHHRHWHPHHGWIVPVIVGGAVVYTVTRPAERIIVQQDPVITNTVICSEWKEIQGSDGVIYRERTCREQ